MFVFLFRISLMSVSNLYQVSIGSGDVLVPTRHQAITWTNVDPGL